MSATDSRRTPGGKARAARLAPWQRKNLAFAAYLDAAYPLWRQWKDTSGMRKLEAAFTAGWHAANRRP